MLVGEPRVSFVELGEDWAKFTLGETGREQRYIKPPAKEASAPVLVRGESPEHWRNPSYGVLRFDGTTYLKRGSRLVVKGVVLGSPSPQMIRAPGETTSGVQP